MNNTKVDVRFSFGPELEEMKKMLGHNDVASMLKNAWALYTFCNRQRLIGKTLLLCDQKTQKMIEVELP